MSIRLKQNEPIPIKVVLEDKSEDKYVVANIYKGSLKINGSPVVIPHLEGGMYFQNTQLMPDADIVVKAEVFESDQVTPAIALARQGSERFELEQDIVPIQEQSQRVEGFIEDEENLIASVEETELQAQIYDSETDISANLSDDDNIIGNADTETDEVIGVVEDCD